MSNGPPPSKITLLTALPSIEAGEKVRFLGCVHSYATSTATLVLEHNYHGKDKDRREVSRVQALVDVKLLLQTLKSEQTQTGEWVNIIGYITRVVAVPKQPAGDGAICKVHVQAIVLWSAGPFDLQSYETAVSAREREDEADSAGRPETSGQK